MSQNIIIFKKFFNLSIIFFGFIQIFLSKSLNDYLILLILVSTNLLISIYCLDYNRFIKYPISISAIFFSILINSGSALYFKTLEFSSLSENLDYALNTFFIIFIANIIIVFTHQIYERNKQKTIKNYFNVLNNKLGLFKIDTKFIFFIGSLSIFLQLIIKPFFTKDLETTFVEGANFQLNILSGFDIFAIFPFILLLSFALFKKKININKITITVFLILLFVISISSNRRDVFFFTLLCFLLTMMICLFLGEIKFNKKKTFQIIIGLIFFIILYDKIIFLNKVYIFERAYADQRSYFDNFKSFKKTFNLYRNNPKLLELYTYGYQYDLNNSDYYNSLLFERINPISYANKIKIISTRFKESEKKKVSIHSLNRIISILPQPIINFFKNDFNKVDYIFLTTSSYIQKEENPNFFSRNEVGSFIIELNIIFGLLFFIPLFIISYLFFSIIDSFYDSQNIIVSPIIITLFYTNGPSVLDFFAAGSIDKNISLLIREIPQSIILYILTYFVYKKILIKNLK